MTDQILYWNAAALEANRISHTEGGAKHPGVNGPTLSSRALAIVHLAMYDAYVGAQLANGGTTLTHYLPTPPVAAPGASVDASIATAAHSILSKLYPNIKHLFDQKMLSAGLNGPNYDAGRNYGAKIAHEIWNLRANDPSDSDDGYSIAVAPGKHRQDPFNSTQPINAPHYGAKSTGFAISKRWGIKAPPALNSSDYDAAIKQVRGKGIKAELMGTLPTAFAKRTVDETLIGLFWAYDGAKELGTPPRLYNQIVREIAMDRGNTLEQNAHLFALVNAAMGDAGILAWDQKYIHDFWRPVLGIREHDKSMGPIGTGNNNIDNDCDPTWLPFGAPNTNKKGENDFTPPFPAYPSGHATFGAASLHMVRLFYGVASGNRAADNIATATSGSNAGNLMNFVSEELNGMNMDSSGIVRPKHTRNFAQGLWRMIVENGLSRVYLGVHWYFDAFATPNGTSIVTSTLNPDDVGIGGVPLGLVIAEDIYSTTGISLSPVGPRT